MPTSKPTKNILERGDTYLAKLKKEALAANTEVALASPPVHTADDVAVPFANQRINLERDMDAYYGPRMEIVGVPDKYYTPVNKAKRESYANPRQAVASKMWRQAKQNASPTYGTSTVNPQVIIDRDPWTGQPAYEQQAPPQITASQRVEAVVEDPWTQAPVIRPATVDLNAAPELPTAANNYLGLPRNVHFERTPQGIAATVSIGDYPSSNKTRLYGTQQEYDNAVAAAQAAGWNVTHSHPYKVGDVGTAWDISAYRGETPQAIPDVVVNDGSGIVMPGKFTYEDRRTKTRSSAIDTQPTPLPPVEPTPGATPTPVIVEDPADNWNRYVPYAAAVGALGLGGAGVYAMTRPSAEDRQQEEARQQQMYQYAMMQKMAGRGW